MARSATATAAEGPHTPTPTGAKCVGESGDSPATSNGIVSRCAVETPSIDGIEALAELAWESPGGTVVEVT